MFADKTREVNRGGVEGERRPVEFCCGHSTLKVGLTTRVCGSGTGAHTYYPGRPDWIGTDRTRADTGSIHTTSHRA